MLLTKYFIKNFFTKYFEILEFLNTLMRTISFNEINFRYRYITNSNVSNGTFFRHFLTYLVKKINLVDDLTK